MLAEGDGVSASVDINNFLRGLEDAKGKARDAAEKAVEKFAWHVIGDSSQLCPVDTGALAASGTVGDVKVTGEQVTAVIGHNTDYAAAVHERLDVHHPLGQPKFLAKAIENNVPKMAGYVIDEVKKAL